MTLQLKAFRIYHIHDQEIGGASGQIVQCPMCDTADVPKTEFCRDQHPVGLPNIDASTHSSSRIAHLHRTCSCCGYTWLEGTAPADVTVVPAG